MRRAEFTTATFVDGKVHKQPIPVLRVWATTTRGYGTQWVSEDVSLRELVEEIAKDPGRRMLMLAALYEEAKHAVQPA